ncbi:PLDc N-terminal domain-containing protein [Microbacterium sulfonylureivorans]|uniref:PLDc N-terminal domain-containing protein n=1 Tax=Microbacterium sulfonylureivorans TaxID=2486854 RepID=UPI000FDA74B5|nr:PLDc N-terminal domain-containing protein [Microbacterium sulfonylureivorans]
MTRALLILALVATAFWVFTIVDCAVQPPTRHRGVSKPVWILIVVLIPVLGGLLWLLVGRVRRSAIAARRAPDDDPEFLGSLGAITDQDERIRRLEEELAQLDAEDDDPRWAADAPGQAAPGTPKAASPDAPPDPPVRPADGDDERGQRGAVS